MYRLLRKPFNTLTIHCKYSQQVEEIYGNKKNFIIRLFSKQVKYENELGSITELIFLINKTKYLSQWYRGVCHFYI